MRTATPARSRTGASRSRGRRRRFWLWLLLAAIIVVGAAGVREYGFSSGWAATRRVERLAQATVPDYVDYQPLEIGNARSGARLEDFTGVVIHYVGNPGTSARNNRQYFAQESTQVCSHFIIGLEGEVIQCLPLEERSAASNSRNRDTISIEVCHPDAGGQFTPATYQAVVELTAWLCRTGHLSADAVIRHYDVTGKLCPLYYVDHEDAWRQLQQDVANRI